jgi:hypothetical protein
VQHFLSSNQEDSLNSMAAANMLKLDPKTLTVGIIGYTGNRGNNKIL